MAQTASLQSPHLEAQYDDLIEDLFARGVTDGLPVVPPTEEPGRSRSLSFRSRRS